MFNNFFRKDLNLEDRWWHRLFRVLFIIAFMYALGGGFISMLDNAQLPKYSEVGNLSDRMDSGVILIRDLVKPEEKIAYTEDSLYGSYNGKPFYDGNGGWLLGQEYYCSRNISSQVEKISEKTGIYNYKGNSNLVSLEDFKKFLIEQNAGCIDIRDLDSVKYFGNVKKALGWGLEADGMKIYKVSLFKTIVAIIQEILFYVVFFAILLTLYYKIFIYIVFGKAKRNNTVNNKTHNLRKASNLLYNSGKTSLQRIRTSKVMGQIVGLILFSVSIIVIRPFVATIAILIFHDEISPEDCVRLADLFGLLFGFYAYRKAVNIFSEKNNQDIGQKEERQEAVI